MKKCPYCNRENSDEALTCEECGNLLESRSGLPSEVGPSPGKSIPTRTRFYLWLSVWGVVMMGAISIKPSYLLAAPFFPSGLLAYLPNGQSLAIESFMAGVCFLGWFLYVLLSVFMFTTRKNAVFGFLFLIFCALVALNLAGCRTVMQSAAGAH